MGSGDATGSAQKWPWHGLLARIRYAVDVGYQPMTLADLARFVAAEADFAMRWRLVVEFLREYHREPAGEHRRLLDDVPGPTGDERWDALLAALAEHLAMRDGPRPRSAGAASSSLTTR
jgi:hypothetical protein